MRKKEDLEIKKWGKSLIKKLVGLHDYLHLRLETENKIERKLILEYKNLLRDIQQYIEMDL